MFLPSEKFLGEEGSGSPKIGVLGLSPQFLTGWGYLQRKDECKSAFYAGLAVVTAGAVVLAKSQPRIAHGSILPYILGYNARDTPPHVGECARRTDSSN